MTSTKSPARSSLLRLFVLLGYSFLPSVEALKPHPQSAALTIIPPFEDECQGRSCEAPSVTQGNQRVDVETGYPVALVRQGYHVKPNASPTGKANQYLHENAAKLGLKRPDLSDLEVMFIRNSAAGDTVRYQQTLDGLPVHSGKVTVTVTPASTVNFVVNEYKTQASLPGGIGKAVPNCSQDAALQAAKKHLGVTDGGLSFKSTNLVIYPRRNGLASLLTWEVRIVLSEEPFGDWEVLHDAKKCQIFKVTDQADYAITYVNGTGRVFDTDPISSSGNAYGVTGFSDGNDANTVQLTSQTFIKTLKDLTFDSNSGLYQLKGPYAEIVDTENPYNGLFPQASPDFDFTRTEDAFEAVNCYYHIDTMMRYLNVDLGLSIMPYQYSEGVRFDPHGLGGSDNSHYTSGNGVIAFGEGGVDDAEDADVVIHELGHGLHDWITGGGQLSQTEGLSEGSGDYLAQSYRRANPNLNFSLADPAYQYVYNWDGHNEFWGGRTTDYGASYPGGLVGQIHTDGQIWSTCNMKIWDKIGRRKTDKAFWSGLSMTSSSTNQQEAAQAVLDAAVNMNMFYSTADVAEIESIYQGCGYSVTVPTICGNSELEGGEECDGANLGSPAETCLSQGCTGGTLACSSTCTFDYSSCTGCPVCGDGICESGEDCTTCSSDCESGTTGAVCGNGVCEAGNGENCRSCPDDCNRQKGSSRFCCGDRDGCSHQVCSSGGNDCIIQVVLEGSRCCGNTICEAGEDLTNCAVDCEVTCSVDSDCNDSIPCTDDTCKEGVCDFKPIDTNCPDDDGLFCTREYCDATLGCLSDGDPCPSGEVCNESTDTCDASTSCGVKGDRCTNGSECCSGSCKRNGTCH